MNFTRVFPVTEAEEHARKKLVITLILAAAPLVILSFVYIKKLFQFLKTTAGLFCVCVAISALLYAHSEPFFMKFSYKELSVKKQFKNFTVVQITDVHFQWPYPYVTESKLQNIVNEVNKIRPDFVFLTGDYVSRYRTRKISQYNTQTVSRYLGQLKANRGVYAILGNNDKCCGNMIIDEFNKNGIKILMNETVVDGDIAITGLTSSRTIEKCNLKMKDIKLAEAPLKICLAHEPDTAVVTHPFFDLQFSGHTHGGQCIGPFGIGPILSPSMGHKFIIGAYKVGRMILHVSTGVGISPLPKPLVRFNNIAEVSVLRIVSEM